ncbi:MAG: hypothetical protein SR3Q1_00805 [Quinella sp. 3Q1]|nr:hypothetical protein [Quinella sp. 3Q1]MBR6886874.1 hypothetical protein [Selenomonadaceae bacterium]
MYLVRDANSKLEFVEPYYYSVRTYDDGHLEISNGSSNSIMMQYDEYLGWKKSYPVSYPYNYVGEKYWDYPKEKVSSDYDDVWEWQYIYVDGKHPTVSGSGANLTGGAGNDYISNGGDNVIIDSGAGADSISNYGTNVIIDASAGKDSIRNEFTGSCAMINGGAGSDSIYNFGSDTTIDGGTGSDYIHSNLCSKVSINGSAGDDTISYGGSDSTIDGGAGSDHITWNGDNSKITGGAGDDYISSGGDNVTINAGAGNDTINNRVRETTIDGGADNDYIKNFARHGDISGLELSVYESEKNSYDLAGHVSINGGSGNNTIENVAFRWHRKDNVIESDGKQVTIHADNAVLEESILGGDDVTITAGAGNDMIQSYGGSRVTINAGGGNNFVSVGGGGENISVKAEDKDDTIVAHGVKDIFGTVADKDKLDGGSNLTIAAGDGKNFISVASSWSNITLNGGSTKGADAIFNGGESALIKGNAGLDVIENKGDFAIVLGGEDGDLLTNYGNNAYIQGDNGKGSRPSEDYIFTNSGDLVTIDAGKDNDTIEAYHDTHASI